MPVRWCDLIWMSHFWYEYPVNHPIESPVLGISWQTWQPRSMSHGMAARWPQVFLASPTQWCPEAPRHPHGGGGVPCRGGVLERETLGLRHQCHEMPWTYLKMKENETSNKTYSKTINWAWSQWMYLNFKTSHFGPASLTLKSSRIQVTTLWIVWFGWPNIWDSRRVSGSACRWPLLLAGRSQ